MSESIGTFNTQSLDEVRARIFYLACDVEPVSAPAAMLLRAVADAIEEGSGERISMAANGSLAEISANGAHARRRFGLVTS